MSLLHGSVDWNISFAPCLLAFKVAPSRERGLKYLRQKKQDRHFTVAPSRERGLKSPDTRQNQWTGGSLLHGSVDWNFNNRYECGAEPCRSFTGAWIEIPSISPHHPHYDVAPSRERGLKSWDWGYSIQEESRSFTGAWIEILLFASLNVSAQSLLHGSVKEKLKKHLTNINNERKVNVR